jgi:phosphoribosylaminoimidazolecarboxamide formyltransferase/IMP cyclohydrolase
MRIHLQCKTVCFRFFKGVRILKKRALISVSDKTGLIEFAKELLEFGYELISTGGTYRVLKSENLPVVNVSEVTGFPECLDGRVKTLHPKIHAGILADRDNPEHLQTIRELEVETIDLVVVNLYPFDETVSRNGVTLTEAIENIDIGGPTMLRSAAKNYKSVVVIVDPKDYTEVIHEMGEQGKVSLETRFRLATKVFLHTAGYDSVIGNYFKKQEGNEEFSEKLTMTFKKAQDLRYGENPHQKAAFYREEGVVFFGIADAVKLHGKELSFNNINDGDSALRLLAEFDSPTVVAVKHANPCGVGTADNILEAYQKAYKADPVSIFGGIIAANETIDEKTAYEINKIFVEIVIAPKFTQEAMDILTRKKNIRILQMDISALKSQHRGYDFKKVQGGLLIQEENQALLNLENIDYVTQKRPSEIQMKDLIFALKVVKHVKSNAIVLAKDGMTVGIGAGQANRVTSLRIAGEYAKESARGAVLASDAFFPFSDCVELANELGVIAIIQPGGSVKDQDSIEECNKQGMSMVITGIRHFNH